MNTHPRKPRIIAGVAFCLLSAAAAGMAVLIWRGMVEVWSWFPFFLVLSVAFLRAACFAFFPRSKPQPYTDIHPGTFFSRTAGVGCCVLGIGVAVIAVQLLVGQEWGGLVFPYLLVISGAFLRAAYLAYFRWSPLAMRHAIGAVFFVITVALIALVKYPMGFVVLAVCYLVYRYTSFELSRRAFANKS